MYSYKAKIVNVVDGDTVDAVVDVGFHITALHRLRLARIDAPELTEKTLYAGVEAKLWLVTHILNEDVLIKTSKSDSFGRYIAEIEHKGVNISDAMLESGLAVHYKK